MAGSWVDDSYTYQSQDGSWIEVPGRHWVEGPVEAPYVPPSVQTQDGSWVQSQTPPPQAPTYLPSLPGSGWESSPSTVQTQDGSWVDTPSVPTFQGWSGRNITVADAEKQLKEMGAPSINEYGVPTTYRIDYGADPSHDTREQPGGAAGDTYDTFSYDKDTGKLTKIGSYKNEAENTSKGQPMWPFYTGALMIAGAGVGSLLAAPAAAGLAGAASAGAAAGTAASAGIMSGTGALAAGAAGAGAAAGGAAAAGMMSGGAAAGTGLTAAEIVSLAGAGTGAASAGAAAGGAASSGITSGTGTAGAIGAGMSPTSIAALEAAGAETGMMGAGTAGEYGSLSAETLAGYDAEAAAMAAEGITAGSGAAPYAAGGTLSAGGAGLSASQLLQLAKTGYGLYSAAKGLGGSTGTGGTGTGGYTPNTTATMPTYGGGLLSNYQNSAANTPSLIPQSGLAQQQPAQQNTEFLSYNSGVNQPKFDLNKYIGTPLNWGPGSYA